jgi:hypothetical protein
MPVFVEVTPQGAPVATQNAPVQIPQAVAPVAAQEAPVQTATQSPVPVLIPVAAAMIGLLAIAAGKRE